MSVKFYKKNFDNFKKIKNICENIKIKNNCENIIIINPIYIYIKTLFQMTLNINIFTNLSNFHKTKN